MYLPIPSVGCLVGDSLANPVQARPRCDVCFVLGTDGFALDAVEEAKGKVWEIASEIVAREPMPVARFALVAYRSRGSGVATRVSPLTDDLDTIRVDLSGLRGGDGGHQPDVEERALRRAVGQVGWEEDGKVAKVIYLIGTASRHAQRWGALKFVGAGGEVIACDVKLSAVP